MYLLGTSMKLSILLLPLLLTSGLLHAQDAINPDSLIGLWGSSEDQGQSIWGYDQYNADGTINSWGTFPDSIADFRIDGRYEISGDLGTTICLTISRTSHPEILPVGTQWCDQIISISEDEFVYQDPDGEQHVVYRQKVGEAYY
ncbi:hypothetical protein AAOGI_40210 [Agarivorans albus]